MRGHRRFADVENLIAPIASLGGAVVGLAKDPDGYTIELLQAPPPKTEAQPAAEARA